MGGRPHLLRGSQSRLMAKVSKSEADYQPTPNGPEQCAGCAMFKAESYSCTTVAGTILPNGWCRYWTKPKPPRKPTIAEGY
jgi:hypothetical protein